MATENAILASSGRDIRRSPDTVRTTRISDRVASEACIHRISLFAFAGARGQVDVGAAQLSTNANQATPPKISRQGVRSLLFSDSLYILKQCSFLSFDSAGTVTSHFNPAKGFIISGPNLTCRRFKQPRVPQSH